MKARYDARANHISRPGVVAQPAKEEVRSGVGK